jgi:gamma-D-glutamyl-L-lysine dipeptidyl-peptidase
MDQLICPVSLVPVRKEPDHRAEQVNQLLFGEKALVSEEIPGWYHIVSLFDSYQGWVEKDVLASYKEEGIGERQFIIPLPLAEAICNGRNIYLPAGSEVPMPDNRGFFNLANRKYQLTEILKPGHHSPVTLARSFLYTPYLWGGRTLFGMDCSGLVQVVFKIIGIKLPRDAWQQSECGAEVTSPDDAMEGDLAFFNNAEGRIIHVGILMEGHQIIHASKSVRADRIDSTGIFNQELNRYTHYLHSVRRISWKRD